MHSKPRPGTASSALLMGLALASCVPAGSDEDERPLAGGGIYFTNVEINQGIGVALLREGVPVPLDEWDVPLIPGRRALIRAGWDVPAGWQSRKLVASLALQRPNERKEYRYSEPRLVNGPGELSSSLQSTFSFTVEAEDVVPGLTLSMALHESDAQGPDMADADVTPRFPQQGTAQLGIEASTLHLHVIMVPFDFVSEECQSSLTFAAEVREAFRQAILARFPINHLTDEWHDNLLIEQTDLLQAEGNPALAVIHALVDLRRDEQPDKTWVYYVGFLDDCGPSGEGIAPVPDSSAPLRIDAPKRVASVTIQSETALDEQKSSGLAHVLDTTVHELGHNHGLDHVSCEGFPGQEPLYPRGDGTIGVWGWDPFRGDLFAPDVTYDSMTYCSPQWTSDYGWSRLHQVISTLTGWEHEPR